MCVACVAWLGWGVAPKGGAVREMMNETKINFSANADALRFAYELLAGLDEPTSDFEFSLLRRALSLINDEIYFWQTCPPEMR